MLHSLRNCKFQLINRIIKVQDMKMNYFKHVALFFVVFLVVGVSTYAQVNNPEGGLPVPCGPGGCPDAVPINTLLALGLAIGGALGIRKTLKKK